MAANRLSAGQSPLAYSQTHTGSTSSMRSQPSSRNSDGTSNTAHSLLFSRDAPPVPYTRGSNEVTPTDNIMNSVADASSSLFQICVSLRKRLEAVPGVHEALVATDEEADADTDPVTLLWRTLRLGHPFVTLYNALQPVQPLVFPSAMKEDKRGKAATFKFLQACVNDLKFPQEECFIVTDLYGDDTTGFVKVARVVNRVLDVLVRRGLIEDLTPSAADIEQGLKRTHRQHVISELVTTERTYVQHLELLQAFKRLVEERSVIPRDAVHDIFLNLNSLLDFQRRFLIKVESINAQPESEQNWGKLFAQNCESFQIYEPYIANQRKCEQTVIAEYPKLKDSGGSLDMRQMVESPTALYGFLMKPLQRLSKYPLLLDDLLRKGDLDEDQKRDLIQGKEAATSVLLKTNEAVDREERQAAVHELKYRVEDWKGHRVEGFGQLLMYGTFTVLKSESITNGKDAERQYHVYLFETILLCCKDIDLSKPKNKLSSRQLTDKRGKPKLQLKGRIFMQNVTDLISTVRQGSYTCQIFWKGDPSVENFIIRFATEDMLRKWTTQIELQRKKYARRSGDADAEDGLDDDASSTTSGKQSRTASSTSLRTRNTSGDFRHSGRYPPGSAQQPQLSLRTRELQQGGESYFSPATESPRTSSSSGTVYPFPRQNVNGYYEEGHGSTRFTAPAMARREPSGRRPSQHQTQQQPQPNSVQHASNQYGVPPHLQPRNRSASSPDFHVGRPARIDSQQPPVPDVPQQIRNDLRSVSTTYQSIPPPQQHQQHPVYPPTQVYRSGSHSPAVRTVPQQYAQYPHPQHSPPPPQQLHHPRMYSPTQPSMIDQPSQIRIKVHCPAAAQTLTLVVPLSISYESLKDRIDAKLQRSTGYSLGDRAPREMQVKLKYVDEDDHVSIQSDEDVQAAFETWGEGDAGIGEIELFCEK